LLLEDQGGPRSYCFPDHGSRLTLFYGEPSPSGSLV
jgi:hypothetical protein